MTRVFAPLTALFLAACTHSGAARGPDPGQTASPRPAAGSTSDLQAIEGFNSRLKDYGALHDRLEKTLAPLPTETSPPVIDRHQRALARLLGESRKDAKRGDIFTPEGERLIRRLLAQAFSGSEGAKLKSTIMDDNPVSVKLAVNGRYPDEVPLSTMPPQVLALLPKLPEPLEYRFIGPRLVLFDVHAHTVADYIESVLPQ